MAGANQDKTSISLSQSQTRNITSGFSQKLLYQLRKQSNYLFVLPMLIFMLLTMGYPIYVNVDMSLQDLNIRTFRAGNAPYIGLDNYTKLIDDPSFWKSARLSFSFTSISLTFQFLIGFSLALFFNRPFPGNGLLRALLLLSWLLPAVVAGTLFRWIADGDYGVFNLFLKSIGLDSSTDYWLLNPDTALIGTIIANVWVGAPFHMMLLLAGLQNISPTLYEAASIDGADTPQRFVNITLPLMRPVILGVLLLGFIYTFKVFELIFVMTGGGPVDATTVLPIQIYRLTFSFFRFGEGAAAAILLLIGLLFLAVGYSQLIRTEETA
ncbi:MAG TPA: sugar ABC transporter permease [Aggregatilineales bacterium]|nr:sugar ABC transporter permease [Aggregatilineales bacterium]